MYHCYMKSQLEKCQNVILDNYRIDHFIMLFKITITFTIIICFHNFIESARKILSIKKKIKFVAVWLTWVILLLGNWWIARHIHHLVWYLLISIPAYSLTFLWTKNVLQKLLKSLGKIYFRKTINNKLNVNLKY